MAPPKVIKKKKSTNTKAEKKKMADLLARQMHYKGGTLYLRELRNQVRFLASMLSHTGGKVKTQMSKTWAATIDGSRIIYWSPVFPLPPHSQLEQEEILFLITHETGHLNYTGGYDVPPTWSSTKIGAFHMFHNFVEDIRIERLMAQKFPGFQPTRTEITRKFQDFHLKNAKDYPVHHQVALSWYMTENGCKPVGHAECQAFARKLWPDVSKIANAADSNEVAQAIIPIFETLWNEQLSEEGKPEDGDPDPNAPSGEGDGEGGSGEGEGQPGESNQAGGPGQGQPGEPGDSEEKPSQPPREKDFGKGSDLEEQADQHEGAGDPFGDEPSNEPSKAPLGEHQKPMSEKDKLQQLIDEIPDQRMKDILENIKEQIESEEDYLENQIDTIETPDESGGPGAGDQNGMTYGATIRFWDEEKAIIRGPINALSHRLRTTLKSNAMGSWEEGKSRGRMNTHRARKAVSGDNRIFRKRTQIGDLDYVFGIAVDTSSSMQDHIPAKGSRFDKRSKAALTTTVLLAEALDKAGMQNFIIPWEHTLKRKKDVTKKLTDDHRASIGTDIFRSNGGTYEAPVLIASQEQFDRAGSSGHKVLFVISDGDTTRPDESEYLAAEMAQKGIKVVAIGLNHDPAAHHETQIRIDNVEDLPRLLPKLINEVVRKGHS